MQVNRTFVGRGSQLGVFKHDEDGQLQYLTRIAAVKTNHGEVFEPSKMMLHQNDEKMLLLHPEQTNTVFEMDLERGKVIQEFGVDEGTTTSTGHTTKQDSCLAL